MVKGTSSYKISKFFCSLFVFFSLSVKWAFGTRGFLVAQPSFCLLCPEDWAIGMLLDAYNTTETFGIKAAYWIRHIFYICQFPFIALTL